MLRIVEVAYNVIQSLIINLPISITLTGNSISLRLNCFTESNSDEMVNGSPIGCFGAAIKHHKKRWSVLPRFKTVDLCAICFVRGALYVVIKMLEVTKVLPKQY